MQIHNSYKALFIIVAAVAFASCKSNFAVLTIENARPARHELPADIQSITLMNRSMNGQFENFQEDSLQLYFYRRGFQLSKTVLDSTAADTTIKALAELLYESGRYDAVVPLERNISRSLSYEFLPDTLSPELVGQYCRDYNTDALMVMERFSTKVMADYTEEKYRDATNSVNRSYYASLDVKYDAFFRIYKPGAKTLVKEFAIVDTIYWESADYTQVRLFSKLPMIKAAIISAGIKIALEVDEKLSPVWTPERRGYFLFKSSGDIGQQLVNENNLAEAGKYWAEMAQSKNKKIRSKAEFNLALMSELNGDIDGALEWGLKSYYSYYRYQTETYLKRLQARKETIQTTK